MESDEDDTQVEVETKRVDKAKAKLDMFNLSNDHLYEQERHAKYRIRQTFGSIEVYHSGPAKSLQLPFVRVSFLMPFPRAHVKYKTTLSKTEARTWRRPPLQFPTGVPFTFSKVVRGAKVNKKALVTDPSESFQTTKDLTMSVRRGSDVLLEFSVSSGR
jgi:transcription initiation factor TFIID subunit 1